jgi:hypothetical protein
MTRVIVAIASCALAALFGRALLAGPAQAASLDQTLAAAASYIDTFSREVAGVVAEEDYMQTFQATVVTARQLKSDMMVIGDPAFGWIEFRDVYEVDGKPVRDRDDRLAKLLNEPSPDALEQARRIVAEGARFNLQSAGFQLNRTINLPMAAMMFLRGGHQPRSRFTRDGSDTVGGQRVMVVRFEETGKPRLIASGDDAAASGKFWIVPESGRVLRTELTLASRRGTSVITAVIRTTYAEQSRLGLWLPRTMEESYIAQAANGATLGAITGRASYSNYRKFRVEVDER